jgi:lon-related putative ATP-dependent protease
MTQSLELLPDQLYRRADSEALGFATTAEIAPLSEALGQGDGLRALEFGVTMRATGYNIFVLGESGSGRRTFVLEALHAHAARQDTPPEWCYVQNFTDPRRPHAVSVSAGRADGFAADVAQLIDDLRRQIPLALDSDSAVERRTAAMDERERQVRQLLDGFRAELTGDEHVALLENNGDVALAPALAGTPIPTQDIYLRLPAEQREIIDAALRDARNRLFSIHRRTQELERDARSAAAQINADIIRTTVAHRIEPLRAIHASEPQVLAHLDRLAEDVVHHETEFASPPQPQVQLGPGAAHADFFKRYQVNVAVRRRPGAGAPVIEEQNPTYTALIGHTARQVHFGVMVTDFTGITAGALHHANGGYLVLEAEELLTRPLAWSALKRVLRTRQLKPVDASGEMGVIVADTLDPEPIPAALKVILVGEPGTFYMLREMDSEFRELFKVKADFRPDMERTPETERAYAAFVAASRQRDGAPPFDAAAVANIIEEGSRIAADQYKLTTRFGLIADIVRESAHWARVGGREVVTRADVQLALRERDQRERRPHRALLELIERRILAFEPGSDAVGQLYGLAVITVGDEGFGRPIRVMATAFVGQGGLSNLEREVAMSGPIHSKAFLLLSGYIARRFARNRPLVLSATISFDQLYEEIEGDSASAAELYALLSAVADVPIHQGVAVTGAVNQVGIILPVGGVTEKIEGFFAACQCFGLTGRQGVIVPRRNIDNLVLREDVRDAVSAGDFHVWAIDRFEEAWPILTGMVAGEPDEDGEYPPGSLYRAVTDRMDAWAEQLRSFQAGGDFVIYEEGEEPAEPGSG